MENKSEMKNGEKYQVSSKMGFPTWAERQLEYGIVT